MGSTDADGARFLDNKRITGAIVDMLESAVDFVIKNSKTKTIIDGKGRRKDRLEYPPKAIREAILNALMHRDYSAYTESTPVSIEMYYDRIEITSKGGMFGGEPVERLGNIHPETRNPVLINLLELMKTAESRFSGIPTMRVEMRDLKLPDPEFIDLRGSFKVVFRNSIDEKGEGIDKRDITKAVIEFCKTPRSRDELTEFCGKSRYHTMSAIVQPLIDEGMLLLTIPEKPKSPKQKFVTSK